MKVKKIEVHNLKAVADSEIELNGSSILVTAGNDKGKTTILRGLIDRIHGEIPDFIVKEGEKNGVYFMDFTDGSSIEWKFTEKSESFAYITKDGIKQTTSVITTIGRRLFGEKFDIDKFLNSSPQEQKKTLQRLAGIEVTDIDNRYNEAYEQRRFWNSRLKELRIKKVAKPEPVTDPTPEIENAKKELKEIREYNDRLNLKWKTDNEKHINEIKKYNAEQEALNVVYDAAYTLYLGLEKYEKSQFESVIDFAGAKKIMDGIKKGTPKPITFLPSPEPKSTKELEMYIEELEKKMNEFREYERKLGEYNKWVNEGKSVSLEVEKANEILKSIEAERTELINKANIPKEFTFSGNELLYKGLPLNNKQISSSAKYIAALKLGSLVLGEVKVLHFDASFLDKNNLKAVETWAANNGLQLLIERPDFDGGDIKYEII